MPSATGRTRRAFVSPQRTERAAAAPMIAEIQHAQGREPEQFVVEDVAANARQAPAADQRCDERHYREMSSKASALAKIEDGNRGQQR